MIDGDEPVIPGAPESPVELEWLRQHDAERDSVHDADTARRQAVHDFDMAQVEAEHAVEIDRLEREVAGLRVALDTRTAIGMAMGLLMARSNLAPDEAFDVLRRASQRGNVKVNTVAAEMVAHHIERIGPKPDAPPS